MAQIFKAKTLVSNSGRFAYEVIAPNLVYNTGDQNVSGVKNFGSRPTVNGTGVLLIGEASAITLPSTIVYTTGNQIISGNKTFVNNVAISGTGIFSSVKVSNIDKLLLSGIDVVISGNSSVNVYNQIYISGNPVLTGTIPTSQTITNVVYTTGDQTISGNKTFASPIVFSSGASIDLRGGEQGIGGSIDLSNYGGSITSRGHIADNEYYGRFQGGNIDLSASFYGNGGSLLLSAGPDGIFGGGGGTIDLRGGGNEEMGGSITSRGDAGGHGGSLNMSAGIDYPGGSINTSSVGNGAGGSINTSASIFADGGYINTSAVDGGAGGNIDTRGEGANGHSGGSILTTATEGGAGGSIDTRGGDYGPGGSINTSNSGGSINTAGDGESTGGSINTSAGVNNGDPFNGGSINTSAGGSINTSNEGGDINTSGSSGGNNGGSINTSASNEYDGGSINTSNGGGSINTSNNGGSIDTRGQGQIQFGFDSTRTTLFGTASENRIVYLPNANGTLALDSNVAITGSILNNKINSLSGYVNSRDSLFSGQISSTGSNLNDKINSLSGLFTTYTGNLDTTFATDAQLFTTGSVLNDKINSLSGYVNSQDIIFSGQTFNTGSRLDNKINSLSGWSASSANLFATGSALYNSIVSLSGLFTGYTGSLDANFATDAQLFTTGSSLDNKINSLSGYVNSQDNIFSGQIFNTGSILDSKINSLSGYVNAQDNIFSGQTFNTGSTLDNKINALSGSVVLTYGNQNIYGIKNFYSGIVITGDGSTNGGYSLVAKNSAGTDGLRFNPTQEGGAGNLYFAYGTTNAIYTAGDSTLKFQLNSNPYRVANSFILGNGSDVLDHTVSVINRYGYFGIGSGFSNPLERFHVSGGNLRVDGKILLSGNPVLTGVDLSSYATKSAINSLSGQVVFITGNQIISGIKTFVDNTVFGDASQGDFLVISGNTFTVYGSGNFTNGLFVSGVPVLTGLPNWYATSTDLALTGSILNNKINALSGYVNSQDIIFSGQTFNTGSRLDNKINSLSGYLNSQDIIFSGQIGSTGLTLDNKINNLSGYINSLSNNIVFTTGNQTILGQKTFSGITTVIGHFAATSKSFLIDHPLDNNKKLQYASLEGPEHGVFLRGKTNENIINLPNYWSALVDENTISVNLTPINVYSNIYVVDYNNTRVITNGNNGNYYFYTIYGERKDIPKLTVEF